MDVSQRIFELAEKKYSQKEFAVILGVKPQRISEWKRGLSSSYQKYLPQIAEALGTTTEYLLTGKETFPDDVIIKIPKRRNISEDALEVALSYDDASPELQAAVRRVLGLE